MTDWTWRVVDPDGNTVEFGTDPIVVTAVSWGEQEEEGD